MAGYGTESVYERSKIEDEALVEEPANGITLENEVARPTGHLIS